MSWFFFASADPKLIAKLPIRTTKLTLSCQPDELCYQTLLETPFPALQSLQLYPTARSSIVPTQLVHNLPPTLRKFKFGIYGPYDPHTQPLGDFDHLPASLENLTLSFVGVGLFNLPTTLRHLTIIRCECWFALDYLPPLVYLCIGCAIKPALVDLDYLPSTLRTLSLRGRVNASVDNLPTGLLRLYIYSNCFDQPLDHLPSGLLVLRLEADKFQQPLDYLPLSLQCLYLGIVVV